MFKREISPSPMPFLISLIIHSTILASLPLFKHFPLRKQFINLEITYQTHSGIKSKKDRGGISKELLAAQQKSLPKTSLPNTVPHKEPLPIDISKLFRPKETISIPKPKISPPNRKKQKIILKDLPVETSKDPAYLNYRDIIRKRIQDAVYYYSDKYFYFDNPQEGKVFVSFIVKSNGRLKEMLIQEDRSSQNNLLRKICLTAIQNASPFDKFPKELNYDERFFNLEISFEIE